MPELSGLGRLSLGRFSLETAIAIGTVARFHGFDLQDCDNPAAPYDSDYQRSTSTCRRIKRSTEGPSQAGSLDVHGDF
jgi:hypothetical protein